MGGFWVEGSWIHSHLGRYDSGPVFDLLEPELLLLVSGNRDFEGVESLFEVAALLLDDLDHVVGAVRTKLWEVLEVDCAVDAPALFFLVLDVRALRAGKAIGGQGSLAGQAAVVALRAFAILLALYALKCSWVNYGLCFY